MIKQKLSLSAHLGQRSAALGVGQGLGSSVHIRSFNEQCKYYTYTYCSHFLCTFYTDIYCLEDLRPIMTSRKALKQIQRNFFHSPGPFENLCWPNLLITTLHLLGT